jgi:hypothetical protein
VFLQEKGKYTCIIYFQKKSITWNDISEEIHYKDCMLYDSNIPLAQKQMVNKDCMLYDTYLSLVKTRMVNKDSLYLPFVFVQ